MDERRPPGMRNGRGVVIGRVWRRLGPWATPVLVVVEVALVWSGVFQVRTAIVVGLVVEALLWATAVSRTIAAVREFGRGRSGGLDIWQALEDGLAQLVPRRVAR